MFLLFLFPINLFLFFFFNDPPPPEISTLPLHDPLPISAAVKFFAYTFTALCAGIAGLIIASDIKEADPNNAGVYVELDAILAVDAGVVGVGFFEIGRAHV